MEGCRFIIDVFKVGVVLKMFFFSCLEYLKELLVDKLKGVSFIKVKFEDIKDWFDFIIL